MERFLAPYSDFIYAAFRIIVGLLFACHGAQKLLGWFGGMPPGVELNAMIVVAGSIEIVGGLMVGVGFQTSIAAFVASGMMAVAYFMVHQPQGPLPIQNQGEPAVLYCFAFLLIAARGSGRLSVDEGMR
jgi:putative oxidoreductase